AGRFLQVPEAVALFGVYLHIFGKPKRDPNIPGQDYAVFNAWLDQAYAQGKELRKQDRYLNQFVKDRQAEIEMATADYAGLMKVVERKGWDRQAEYDIATMKRPLSEATGLSDRAKKAIVSARFERGVLKRKADG